MTSTRITVQGSFESFHPAERATVSVAVGFEGPDRARVVTGTTQASQALVAGLRQRHDPQAGPVTWWASDRLQVWSTRPFHDQGEQLPLVHHAVVSTRAKFRDFDALAHWVERAAAHPGVRVDGIAWTLTEATRLAHEQQVRRAAVEDAQHRARTYAEALGLAELTCLEIAEPGMLGDGVHGEGAGAPMAFARAAKDSAGGLSFTPEDISIAARVDARFSAR